MSCCTQLMLALTASLGYLTIGLIRGWSSPGMPSMLLTSPHLVPSDTAVSWVCTYVIMGCYGISIKTISGLCLISFLILISSSAAVPPLGAFCGSLVTGPFLQKLGRKKTLLIAAPIFSLSWVIIGAATNTSMLVVGRLLSGLCAGIVMPSAQVYVSECSQPDIRGILGSLPALFMAIGVLIAYIIGTWLPWDRLAFASALFPAALFLLLIPLPESPSWLRSRGFKEAAHKSAKWLNHDRKMSTEYREPSSFRRNSYAPGVEIILKSEKFKSKEAYSAEALLRRPVLIPFGLVVSVLVFQQFSGIDTILFYTVSIFEASGSFVDNYLATFLVGLVQVLATAVSLLIIDRYGRKPLLIFSGTFMAISMSALGLYFYAHEHQCPIAENLGLVPVISLMVFMGAFSLGFANVPFLLMGELLPVKQRSILSSIASAFNLGSMFLVIKSYHDIKHFIGDHGVFWSYAIICIASCFFVLCFIPETKGKSLEDIEKHFERSFIVLVKDSVNYEIQTVCEDKNSSINVYVDK